MQLSNKHIQKKKVQIWQGKLIIFANFSMEHG